MKKYSHIILLSVLISCATTKPPIGERPIPIPYVPYIVTWKCKPYEYGVISYKLQKSTNNKSWTTVTTIPPKNLPDSNIYTYTLPKTSTANYWRIYITMKKPPKIKQTDYITDSKYLPNTNAQ